jgi:hypothetical protein
MCIFNFKSLCQTGYWWLTPVILAISNADVRRIEVQGEPRQLVLENIAPK